MIKFVKLGDACLVRRGTTITRKQTNKGNIPVIAGGKKATYFHNKHNRESNTITISGSGASAGLVNYWQIPIFASDCSTVELKDNKQNIKFVYYYMQSMQELIYKEMRSGAAQPHVYAKDIANLNFPLISLKEQQRIVAKLDAAFAEIDSNILVKNQNYDELNSLKISILNKIFDGPKIRLGDLYEITSSKRVFKSEWKEKGIPFYRAREIVKLAKKEPFKNPIYISQKMYDLYSKKYSSPQEGDILITGVGTLGVTYLVKKDDKFYFKDGNIIWLKKKGANINSNYVEFVFKSPFVKSQITNSIGATVGTLTIQKAKELSIPCPSLEIQNKIMNKINNIFSYINDYENNLKKTINSYSSLKINLLKYYLENKST